LATEPTNPLIIWASDDVTLPNLAGSNKVKPIDDLISKGWDFSQKPAADEFNYLLNNYGQWIDYLTNYVDEIVISGATGDAATAGAINYFARNSAPVGYLKANGAAVSITTYSNLATAIYVGDTLNATALFGYKCTDSANPNTTRSTSGTFIVLPDLRGEFIRGWDDSRGVDSGRGFGTEQSQDIQSHRHDLKSPSGDQYYVINDLNTTPPSIDVSAGAFLAQGPDASDDARWYPYTGYEGSTETRPRNISLLACIKY